MIANLEPTTDKNIFKTETKKTLISTIQSHESFGDTEASYSAISNCNSIMTIR